MKRTLIIAAALVLAIGAGTWWFAGDQVIKRRTNKLMRTLTMDEGSGAASRHFNTLALGGLIAEGIALETPTIGEANGDFGRSEIESGFAWLAGRAKFTKFEVVDFTGIEVSGERAFVSAVVEAVVALPEYRPADGLYAVEFTWFRADDGWRLERARWTESR